jgi:hypothetical protein
MREKDLVCANPECNRQFSTNNPHQRFHNTACGIKFHKKKLLKPRPLKPRFARHPDDPMKRTTDIQLNELLISTKQDIHDHLMKLVYFKSKLSETQEHNVNVDNIYYYVDKIEDHAKQLAETRKEYQKALTSAKIRASLKERVNQCLKI